jgi:hypothetical protein
MILLGTHTYGHDCFNDKNEMVRVAVLACLCSFPTRHIGPSDSYRYKTIAVHGMILMESVVPPLSCPLGCVKTLLVTPCVLSRYMDLFFRIWFLF